MYSVTYVPSAFAAVMASSTTFFRASLPSFMPKPYCSPVSNWVATLVAPLFSLMASVQTGRSLIAASTWLVVRAWVSVARSWNSTIS